MSEFDDDQDINIWLIMTLVAFCLLVVTLSTCTSLYCHLGQPITWFFPSMNNLPTVLHVSWMAIPSFHLHAKISFMFINHDWRARQARLWPWKPLPKGPAITCSMYLRILHSELQSVSYLMLSLFSGEKPSFPWYPSSHASCCLSIYVPSWCATWLQHRWKLNRLLAWNLNSIYLWLCPIF